MAWDYPDYEVDPFNSDTPSYMRFRTSFYSGTDQQFIVPAAANYPSPRDTTPTRYFASVPLRLDVSDLGGSRPMILRDADTTTVLTRVSGTPGANEYRVSPNSSTRRTIFEMHSGQAGHYIDYDFYVIGGELRAQDIWAADYREYSAGAESQVKIKRKIVEIGTWNMDVFGTKTAAHGLPDVKKIISAQAMIINDAQTLMVPLDALLDETLDTSLYGGSIWLIDSTDINMRRVTSGFFDGTTSYDSDTINRGYIIIEYFE